MRDMAAYSRVNYFLLLRLAIERAPLYPVRVRPRAPSSFLKRLKCCSHDETETFGHLANVRLKRIYEAVLAFLNSDACCYALSVLFASDGMAPYVLFMNALLRSQVSTPTFACKFHPGMSDLHHMYIRP